MVHALLDTLAPAAMERLTLLINHVIGREPVAMQRLRPHAGAVLRVDLQGWPGWLPPLPELRFRVSPAGLMEWVGAAGPSGAPGPLAAAQADPAERPPSSDDALVVRLDASRPDQIALGVLQGRRPAVQVEGDAALAAEVNWLAEHLRWDIADDLQRLLGPALAQGVVSAGRAVADAVAEAASRLAARAPAGFSAPGATGSPGAMGATGATGSPSAARAL